MTTKITGEQIGELTGLGILLTTLGYIIYLHYSNPNNDKQLSREEQRNKRRARTSDAAMSADLARFKRNEYINEQSQLDAESAIKRAEQNYREAQGVKHKKIKISKRTHTKSKNNKSRRNKK